tara:strand:- start:226 stop:909 length:684 start_codon:yes stop_codon:yes gene_type:complete
MRVDLVYFRNEGYFSLPKSKEVIMEDYEVKAIRVWIRSVMDTKQWTANKWATQAGTSPTNITRFLNGSKFLPSSKTIARLANVAGSSPDLGGIDVMSLGSQVLPLISCIDLEVVGSVTVYNIKGDLIAYKFDRDLTAYNLSRGDTIVVRKQNKFEQGDLVAHAYLKSDDDHEYQNREQAKEVGLGYKLKGHNEIWKIRRQVSVALADIKPIGKVVQIIKNLEAPSDA